MATYSFFCRNCDEIDINLSVNEKQYDRAICPTCNAVVKRIFKPISYKWNGMHDPSFASKQAERRGKENEKRSKDPERYGIKTNEEIKGEY